VEGEDGSGAQKEDVSGAPGKEGVNLGVSGALAAETNTFANTLVKYSEPPEARKPRKKWRLYVFKGREGKHFFDRWSKQILTATDVCFVP